MIRYLSFFVFIGSYLGFLQMVKAQHTTIHKPEKSTVIDNTTKHHVMLIPFEPRLYMSEIDFSINKTTGLNAAQIKHSFRDGINEKCYKSLKANGYKVTDLMEDTAKYKKELFSIYSNLSYDYVKVPNQSHYKAPKTEKKQKGIEKGQVQVETNSTDQRFMNAKLTNAKLVPLLYKTYKTDIFVFINQLDLKTSDNAMVNSGITSDNRKIIWHYTIYSYDAIELNSGTVEMEFPAKINDPKKITSVYFAQMADVLSKRLNLALGVK
jgi:hypothetical protein